MPKAGAVEVRAVEFDVHEVLLPRLLIALPGPAAIRIPVPIGPGRSAGDVVRREGVGVRGEHRPHLRTRRRFEILSATSRPSSTSGASAPSRSGRRSPTISRNAHRTSPSCEQIRLGMPTRLTTRCSTAHRTSPSCGQIRLGMPTRMTTRCSTAAASTSSRSIRTARARVFRGQFRKAALHRIANNRRLSAAGFGGMNVRCRKDGRFFREHAQGPKVRCPIR